MTEFAGQHRCTQLVDILRLEGFDPQCSHCGAAVLRGAVVDSREAGPDLLFVARRGERGDGHDYIAAAYENGCRYFLVAQGAVIPLAAGATFIAVAGSTEEALFSWARAYRRSLRQLYVVALSGSYGKTSTKELLGWILAQRYRCHVTAGNRNTPIGCALTILGIAPETELAVLELGIDHPGEMDLLSLLAQPNAALLTGIGSAHLGGFGSREELAHQKGRIYAHLRPCEFGQVAGPVALLPAEDAYLDLLRAQVVGQEVLYSAELAKQQGYGVIDRGLEGLRFTFSGQVELRCDLPLLGRHTQQVFWAAAAVAQNLGLSVAEIFAGARHYQPLFGRGELLQTELRQGGSVTLLQDCYNASPESLYALIEMLHSWEEQGLLPPCVLVLADMLELGLASTECHRKVAELLCRFWGVPRTIEERHFVLLYGTEMKEAWSRLCTLPISCSYLNNEAELQQAMVEALSRAARVARPLLVLKGSRGMHLEKIAQKILL